MLRSAPYATFPAEVDVRQTCWFYCLLAVSLLLTVAPCQSNGLPRFEDYRVSSVYRGPVKPPKFGNIDQYTGTDVRCFGEDPVEYAKGLQTNFAGHFVINACTCGTGCHYLFMWDALTGKLYRHFPFHSIDINGYDVETGDHVNYKGEQYRVDSTLLIIEACLEDTCDCATWYYSWNGTSFKQIAKNPVRKPAACLQ